MLTSEVTNGMPISKQVYSPIIMLILIRKLLTSNLYGSATRCLVVEFCKKFTKFNFRL